MWKRKSSTWPLSSSNDTQFLPQKSPRANLGTLWPEVIDPMKTTTADSTINAMRNIFARYGLPAQVVSDNGPPFQSAEYEEFLQQNSIQIILVSPYHPSSNGLAEQFAQMFKHAMESSADDPASSIQWQIQNFLLSYRSTPHATTSSSHTKLFLQRELRTQLSLVTLDIGSLMASQQDKMKCNHDKFAKYREIAVGNCVLPRDRLSGQKWQAGTVVQQTSPVSFQVQLNDGRNWRRHVDDVLQNTLSSAVNPALSKLHLINLLKALLLLVPKAVNPHLKNQSQWGRQAHILLPPLLRVGPNVLLNHHRD